MQMNDIKDKLSNFFDIYAIFDAPTLPYWNVEAFNRWLGEGCNGLMEYMSREGRGELSKVFKDAKSIIVVGKSYKNNIPKDGIALFACAEDYHIAIKRELQEVLEVVQQKFPNAKGRAVVDTAPIFEKALAVRGGLGWAGRNSLVINEHLGSFFNIGVLLLNVSLEKVENLSQGSCGECMECVNACPMNAIRDDRMVDAKACISYKTIELPRLSGGQKVEICGWKHGCDICQLACPFNAKS